MAKPLRDEGPPLTDRVNDYDEAHLASYLRLLDADAEGADWRDAVRIIFNIDVEADPERARRSLLYTSQSPRDVEESGIQSLAWKKK